MASESRSTGGDTSRVNALAVSSSWRTAEYELDQARDEKSEHDIVQNRGNRDRCEIAGRRHGVRQSIRRWCGTVIVQAPCDYYRGEGRLLVDLASREFAALEAEAVALLTGTYVSPRDAHPQSRHAAV